MLDTITQDKSASFSSPLRMVSMCFIVQLCLLCLMQTSVCLTCCQFNAFILLPLFFSACLDFQAFTHICTASNKQPNCSLLAITFSSIYIHRSLLHIVISYCCRIFQLLLLVSLLRFSVFDLLPCLHFRSSQHYAQQI